MSQSLIKNIMTTSSMYSLRCTLNRSTSRYLKGKCSLRKFHCSAVSLQTMKDVRNALDKWMEFEEGFRLKPKDRSHLLQYLAKSQDELPPRNMKDSFSTAIIPLSSKPSLQHRYSTVTGKLRMGRIMEDMDFFAVYIALKHIKNPNWKEGQPSPYVIVTAAIDDIEFTPDKPDVTNDVKLSGKVVYAGRSSMDISVNLERKVSDSWQKMTVAHFTMVARNSTLTDAAVVNRLQPGGPEEEKELKEALARKKKKKAADEVSLLKTPPNADEQKLIHDFFMKSVDLKDVGLNRRILPAGSVWMSNSILTSCFFPHPENRNHHNTVFGGFLIRQALQLAWMTAYNYSAQKPSLRYISNITFKKAVSISSFLQVKGQVIYTHSNHMQIAIYIEMLDIVTKQVETSNSLYFTYEVKNPVPQVVPKTYHEAMLWLEGIRQFKKAKL